jgi:replication-associated recombination protein RarA
VPDSGPPQTPHGHDPFEAASALQKMVRRGQTEDAVYWAWQMYSAGLGAWAWRRVRTICSEDVGHAWPEGPAVINALHGTALDLGKKKGTDDALLPLVHAVILLAEAPKSRLACWMAVAFSGGAVPPREAPDVAKDRPRGWACARPILGALLG